MGIVMRCLVSCLWLLWMVVKFMDSPYEEFCCFLRGEYFSCAEYFMR
jgi:hypothetical protein